ncbi:MAG: IS110 family transposase [Pseudonocardiaceae bacterium]
MTNLPPRLTAGVDTHLDVHVCAVLDQLGTLLGVESFVTTAKGYRQLLDWAQRFGTVVLFGIEGTGSYGAGLTRYLLDNDIAVVEVSRPNRQRRRAYDLTRRRTVFPGAVRRGRVPKRPRRRRTDVRGVARPGETSRPSPLTGPNPQ